MAAPAGVPDDAGHPTVEPGVDLGDPWAGVDVAALKRAVSDQAARPVTGAEDMASYLAAAVSDISHREVVGPLLNGGGASGVVLHGGTVVASWGDPARAEMAFSATVWPAAPRPAAAPGATAAPNLLWVDPARDLVISSRWGAEVESLLAEVSAAVNRSTRAGG